jgi:hypothetical protein
MRHASLGQIMRIRSDARKTNEFHLIRIQFPQSVTDRYPEMYGALKAISPFPQVRSEVSGDVFRLAIHVRRGELFAVDSHRMLPNSQHFKKLDIPFVCELYAEVPSAKFVVTPRHHGIEERFRRHPPFDEIHKRRSDRILAANGDSRRVGHKRILLQLRSGNPEPIGHRRLYHPCARSPLKDWLVSERHGLVSDSELIAPLESWKRERCETRARG